MSRIYKNSDITDFFKPFAQRQLLNRPTPDDKDDDGLGSGAIKMPKGTNESPPIPNNSRHSRPSSKGPFHIEEEPSTAFKGLTAKNPIELVAAVNHGPQFPSSGKYEIFARKLAGLVLIALSTLVVKESCEMEEW